MHRVAIDLYVNRRNDVPGKAAYQHLEASSDDAGIERHVQLGMLTDAQDEGLLFTRVCDSEEAEKARILAETTRFLDRIKVLFVDGKAMEMGFTAVALT